MECVELILGSNPIITQPQLIFLHVEQEHQVRNVHPRGCILGGIFAHQFDFAQRHRITLRSIADHTHGLQIVIVVCTTHAIEQHVIHSESREVTIIAEVANIYGSCGGSGCKPSVVDGFSATHARWVIHNALDATRPEAKLDAFVHIALELAARNDFAIGNKATEEVERNLCVLVVHFHTLT